MTAARLLLALVVVSLVVPAAAAQAPEARLFFTMDAGPVTIQPGTNHTLPYTINLYLANVVCSEPATASIAVAYADVPSAIAGVMAHPTPVSIVIPQGPYFKDAPAAATPANKSGTGSAVIMVTSSAPSGHNHTFAFTATLTPSSLDDCKGSGSIPAATATANHAIKIPPAPTTTAFAGSPGGGNTTAGGSGGDESPGLAGNLSIAMLVALVIVMARRRRSA